MSFALSRRRLVTLSAGLAALGAVAPRAQTSDRIPLIGFLMGLADDKEAQARISAFEEGFAKQGWSVTPRPKTEAPFGSATTRLRSAPATKWSVTPRPKTEAPFGSATMPLRSAANIID